MVVVANLVDLSAIAAVGSACSLTIFLLIGVTAFRLRREIGAATPIAAIAVTAAVLVVFGIDTVRNAPETFAAIVAVSGLAVVLELVCQRARAHS